MPKTDAIPQRLAAGPTDTDRRAWLQAGAAALAAAALPAWPQDKPALQRIRERGSLVVGVYNDMPPFNVNG